MANYPRKRKQSRSKNFVAIPIEGSIVIEALASKAVVIDDAFGGNLTEDLYAISADVQGQVIGLTAGEGDPSSIGFAHGDYSVGEIAENKVVVFLGPGSKIEQERARRLIRNVGPVLGDSLGAQTTMRLHGRGGAGLVRTKLKFTIQSGKDLIIFFYNNSGATLTTGASFRYSGTVYGRWLV